MLQAVDERTSCRRILTRKKIGFDIPAHEWLRGSAAQLGRGNAALRRKGLSVNYSVRMSLEASLQDHLERRVNVGYHLWGLMILLSVDEKVGTFGRPSRASTRMAPADWHVYT